MEEEIINKTYPIESPHSVSIDKIIQQLHANKQCGLTEAEVQKRIEAYGLNSYKAKKAIINLHIN